MEYARTQGGGRTIREWLAGTESTVASEFTIEVAEPEIQLLTTYIPPVSIFTAPIQTFTCTLLFVSLEIKLYFVYRIAIRLSL